MIRSLTISRFILLPLVASLPACAGGSDGCGNDVIARSPSPNGHRNAVLFDRDCGATTEFSTQVSIVNPGEGPSGAGNAFRADDDHGVAVMGHWEGPWAEMKWLAPDHLLIRYAAKSRIFAQESKVSGVQITYQAIDIKRPPSGRLQTGRLRKALGDPRNSPAGMFSSCSACAIVGGWNESLHRRR